METVTSYNDIHSKPTDKKADCIQAKTVKQYSIRTYKQISFFSVCVCVCELHGHCMSIWQASVQPQTFLWSYNSLIEVQLTFNFELKELYLGMRRSYIGNHADQILLKVVNVNIIIVLFIIITTTTIIIIIIIIHHHHHHHHHPSSLSLLSEEELTVTPSMMPTMVQGRAHQHIKLAIKIVEMVAKTMAPMPSSGWARGLFSTTPLTGCWFTTLP